MTAPVIEIRNLSKRYSRRGPLAVDNLSLTVPAAGIYGFLGANGAGKTTTIKILLGLQFATSGEVKLFGGDPSSPEAKRRIGYLPERPYFHDAMYFEEFLNFHRDLFGRPGAGKSFLGNEELASLVGLRDVAGRSLKQFSKGMLQRAGIAQALLNDPDLIILDEPMSGLDPVGRREMRDLILRLQAKGKTIFLSSHILSDVEQICSRIAFLEKGVLRREGSVSELLRPGQAAYDLVLAGAGLDKLFAGAAEAGGHTHLVCATAGEARAAIERAWAAGGTLISCGQRQRNLEEVLFGSETK